MTKIKILKRDDYISGFEAKGHTEYAEEGEDIVCAAISSITQTACLGITQVLKIKATKKQDDKNAFLKLSLPNFLAKEQLESAQIVLETMVAGLIEIQRQYKKFVKLEEHNEI